MHENVGTLAMATYQSKILLVEDDPVLAIAVASALRGHGDPVKVVGNVSEGLQALSTDPPDLLVLDINLPDGEGWEIAAEAQSRTPPPLVIIVSSNRVSRSMLRERNIFRYFPKPFDMADILTAIEEAKLARKNPERRTRLYKRIIVPLDRSELSGQVIPYVITLAKGLHADVELLNVLDLSGLALATGSAWTYLDVEAIRSDAEQYVERVAWRIRSQGINVDRQVLKGTAAQHILEEAEKDPTALIAISTHGNAGIARWALGSTTEKVLQATANPMLIVRSRENPPTDVRLKTIIVALDGSAVAEQVLPHVVELATALELDVTLFRAIPSEAEYRRYLKEHVEVGPGPTMSREFSGPYEEFSNAAAAEAMEYLHGVSQDLQREGITVEERLLKGDPAALIIDLAQATSNNLVAMTTHGRTGLQRWMMGSVADRVVRNCGDPVLLVRATATE
jgi:nucleotide-binding universal stress UspA family protein/CheY-like chemotaxis protein